MSAHGQCLHVNLTDRVGFLIEHGDNGIITYAVHHEVLGQDIIIHIVHLIRTNVFRGVASNGEILVVGQQVSSHENAVVTHEQVVVHDRMIKIEIEIEWSWSAPFPVAEGTQHELTFKGDVHDGVHRNRFVHRNEMSVLVDTSCLAVLLNGDNRFQVGHPIIGGHISHLPCPVTIAYSSLDYRVQLQVVTTCKQMIIVDILVVHLLGNLFEHHNLMFATL